MNGVVVGITGVYCSGKSLAAAVFEELGFTQVDVDRVGHRALELHSDRVAAAFGDEVLAGGAVDRRKLGAVVFGDPEKKRELERIVHPWMIREVRRRVQQPGDWVINAALLVEMCLFVLCDAVIAVTADRSVLIERAVRRDGISPPEAQRRLEAQTPVKAKLHLVDIVIENNGGEDAFRAQVRETARSLLEADRGSRGRAHGR
ncbi:MAG: dephospho-CoA kinase [Spirochaetota bacterium]